MILQKDREIQELRQQLTVMQDVKTARLDDSLFSEKHYNHYMNIAKCFAKSELAPKNYRNKPEDCFIAMAMGYQLGLAVEQSLQSIAVINGNPCIWGDGLLALIMSCSSLEYMKDEFITDKNGKVTGSRCIIKRRNFDEHIVEFTEDDAKKAGLLGKPGPWSQYPTRMMQWRARGFACRDRFPDVLRGIKMAEEVMDYIDGEVIDKKTVAQNKLGNVLGNIGESHATAKTIDIPAQVCVSELPDTETLSTETETMQKRQHEEMGKDRVKENVLHDPTESEPITDELLDEITSKMAEKEFTEERKTKMLSYLRVDCLESMTIGQAKTAIKIIDLPAKA